MSSPVSAVGDKTSAVQLKPYFTKTDDPFEGIEWDRRRAVIQNADGTVVFEMEDVEVPASWSQRATDIVVSKYFRKGGVPKTKTETSVRQVVHRIADALSSAGQHQGYFTPETGRIFYRELAHLLVNQVGCFNSPVLFNVGLAESYNITGESAGNWAWVESLGEAVQTTDGYSRAQASACFIRSVEDDLMSIAEGIKTEMRLFKYGSGTGTNFSRLRAIGEPLSSGGSSSGVMSFLRAYDTAAGSVKSGGATRRAAKMVILDADHPDVERFIDWKVQEERKAKALIAAGFSGGIDGEAYRTVSGQNANNTVRVTDGFMRATEKGDEWSTRFRTSGEVATKLDAKKLLRKIASAVWECGDPGIQFHDTINKWNPTPNAGKIRASNPCGEFMFVDESACNLASLNLVKFLHSDGTFDIESFRQACRVFILAQEIIVDYASYPTKKIAENSHRLRPLGLGYANLGGLLMRMGLPYDSDEGRAVCSAITALMSGTAWEMSAEIAMRVGPFTGFAFNRDSMLRVGQMHKDALDGIPQSPIRDEATLAWERALDLGGQHGFRNAQLSLLAPTGTVSFLMDCDTTGIEPTYALIAHKKLAGGGTMKITSGAVIEALHALGYEPDAQREVAEYIDDNGKIEGAPHVRPEHYPVFSCATGEGAITPKGHLGMMAAAQPFLCGGISKTCNLPKNATVEQIEQLYRDAWEMGLKAVAVFRAGSKGCQVLTSGRKKRQPDEPAAERAQDEQVRARRRRHRLPKRRTGFTQEATIGGHKVYLRTGDYEDGSLGEIFIDMHKEGATLRSLLNTVAISISLGLQHGVPLEEYVDAFTWTRFLPAGPVVGHDHVKTATSIIDYIFKVLAVEYLGRHDLAHVHPLKSKGDGSVEPVPPTNGASREAQICPRCGGLTQTSGTCSVCVSCGETTGCS